MTTEVRPINRHEAADYLRVLPFANGLPSWEPQPAAWHAGSEPWPRPNPPASPEQIAAWTDEVLSDSFHTMAAFVDGKLVGASGMVSLDITAPGPVPVRLGGVAGTAVAATHRRRGLLRLMMQSMFDAALERGEVLAGLSASEGSIYGRFGFAPATWRARWEIQRSQAALRDASTTGALELVDAATARSVWPLLWDRHRAARVGELSAQPDQWSGLDDAAHGDDGPTRYLLHRDETGDIDGIANFHLPWSTTPESAGTLVVDALCALDANAERDLWRLLLDFDLTKTIAAASRPADEPLRWLLANPRALRITRLSDNLWIRLLDVPGAMRARRYEIDGSITFRVPEDPMCPRNTGTWRLDVRDGEGTCTTSQHAPDLELTPHALGSLYLGGMSVANLAAAGQIRSDDPGTIGRLGRLLRTDPEPHNTFGF